MRIQFKTGLILASLIIIGLLSSTILFTQWLVGQKASHQVAQKIFETTASKVQSQVTNLINIPLSLSNVISQNPLIQKPKDNGLTEPVLRQIFQALEEYPSLYSIYLGHEDGSFFQMIAARRDKGVLAKHKAPENTQWIIRTILTNEEAKRVQHWSFLDDALNLLKTYEEAAPDYDPRQRPWYKSAQEKDSAALSNVYVFNSLQQPGITASHILPNKDGVLGIDMTLSGLSAFVSDQKLSENGLTFIYDRQNRIIALPSHIKGVDFLSDAASVPSETVQALFDGKNKDDFYAKSLELLKEGPGFKIGISAPISDFTKSYREMQNKIFIIIALFIVIFIPAVFYFSQLLAKRVKLLAENVKCVQNGDFSMVEQEPTKIIELSELENSFSEMRQSLKEAEELHQHRQREQEEKLQRQIQYERYIAEFETSMNSVFEGLDSANSTMKETSAEMQVIAQHTQKQSTSVSQSAEVTSTNVETVASAAEELSASIAEIATQVNEATRSTLTTVSQANDTSEKIRILEDNISKIGEFVLMITDIAEQTNMLALNATIEAARAGAAGKGFAVVAGEVKNLANQTSKATEEITKQIKTIQIATHDSVDAINNVSKSIEEVQMISSAISSAMEQQRATTSEIACNVEQAANETQNVSTEIRQLRETANRSESASNDIGAAANDLSAQDELLRKTVKEFLSRVHTSA
ncbi:MAG: hypothetical protein HWE30_05205 [Methylocystaceae bacterium]|nr:hypothetical protein [Methylocystaceae bacterium]